MHSFFVSQHCIRVNSLFIRGSDASHIRDVLRMKPGDNIHVLDGEGFCLQVEIINILKKGIEGKVLSRKPYNIESSLKIRLGQAILKGNKFDSVVRKSVELGTTSIVPLITKRTIVRVSDEEFYKKTQRWRNIAEEASKQCGRNQILEVDSNLMKIEMFCSDSEDFELKLCFWEDESTCRIQDIKLDKTPREVAILIGPEGGFDPEEVVIAKNSGFHTVSLGPRLLRAETAPVAALAILQNRWGDI